MSRDMYISGNNSDFNSRMHQVPTGTGDIASYILEGRNYISNSLLQISGKLEKEARNQNFRFTQNSSFLVTQQF